MGYSKVPFLQQFKINRIHHTRRKWKIVSNDKELAEIFNEFFVNIVPNLSINTYHSFLINTEKQNDPIEKAVAKYKNHPSIISIIRLMVNSDSSFSFQRVPNIQFR